MSGESFEWWDEGEGSKSKSQRKREHHEIKELGERLLGLPGRMLDALELSVAAREAIDAARKLKHGALQRQLRHLANILEAEDDPARVRATLDRLQKPSRDDIRALQQLERWRDALVAGDESCLDEIAARAPGFDADFARALAAAARVERAEERPPKSARKLYAYLRDL
jgi:ribosome-associated protein